MDKSAGPITMAEGPSDDSPAPSTLAGCANVALWTAFQSAARKLKQAESAVQEARAEYAEAVKKLSEEAVR